MDLETSELVLEYFKVILDFPFLSLAFAVYFTFMFREGIKALLLRVGKIRFPWGELSTTQSNIQASEKVQESEIPSSSVEDIISDLTQDKQQEIQQLANSYIENSTLWEFRYLNLFLVDTTEYVLDWIISYKQPISAHLYDSIWLPIIPSANERGNIFNALQGHHLITFDQSSGMITVTQKGFRYQQWRGGPLPPPQSTPPAPPVGTPAGTS